MLSCGKVLGYLSKITRHAHAHHLNQSFKYVGVIGVHSLNYSDDASAKGPRKVLGTTIKPEECIPSSKYSNAKKQLPACEARPDGNCPPSCYEVCGQPDHTQSNIGGKQDGSNQPPSYWKQIVAAIVIAGVAIYALSSSKLFTPEETAPKKVIHKKKVEVTRRKKRPKEKIKNPVDSSTIPEEVQYLLIGGGTAAFSAFRSIKSRDPKAKVLVVTEEEDHPYMRPPLSKELWYNNDRTISAQLNFKQWNGTTRSLFYEPPEFYSALNNLIQSDKGGVAVATGWKVTKIDVTNKVAFLEDGYRIRYNKCLIATGSSPKSLPIFDTAEEEVKERVITFRTKEDFLELENNLHLPDVKNVVIIGGGFLGSELACSLAKNCESKKIYQVYKEKFIMAQVLPEYLSEWTTKKAVLEGVQCVPNVEVEDFSYKNGHLFLKLTSGQTIEADQVIVAVGAEANTDLAAASQLEVNPDVGGYHVNAELEARTDVWVAGDAACFYDVKLGRRRVEHHDHAVVSGRLAGENMTGAGKPYSHQSMFWSDLGPEVGYEAIGIIDSSLPTVGVFVKPSGGDASVTAVSTTNEGTKSTSEEVTTEKKEDDVKHSKTIETDVNSETTGTEKSINMDDFGKGVIFYLRDDVVVGIVLWNIFNRMPIARQVLARGTTYDDLNEVSKLFTIHDD